MSLPMFKACVAGYEDRLFDYQIMAVHSGFWSGYWSSSKKPKPLKYVLDKLLSEKNSHATRKQKHCDEVDVDAFLAMEQRFNKLRKQQGK